MELRCSYTKAPFLLRIYINYFTNFSFLLIEANIDPEILCQIENIAPGRVDNGLKAKLAVASDIAKPLFCIHTSMARAVALL